MSEYGYDKAPTNPHHGGKMTPTDMVRRIEELEAEIERLEAAVAILEDALQEAGDDYPGSSMQQWCQQQVKAAHAALTGGKDE